MHNLREGGVTTKKLQKSLNLIFILITGFELQTYFNVLKQGSQTRGPHVANAHLKNLQTDEFWSYFTQFEGFIIVLRPAKAFLCYIAAREAIFLGIKPLNMSLRPLS